VPNRDIWQRDVDVEPVDLTVKTRRIQAAIDPCPSGSPRARA
jgi:hypothetical protein